MPVEHDFTEEELQALSGHGVAVSQPVPVTEEPIEPTPIEPAPAEPAPVEGQRPRDPETGQFVAAAPEQQPTDPNAPPAAPPPGFVPHQALHEARERERAARQAMATLQARTNALLAARQQAPQEMPDLQEDPVGYVRGLEERLRQFEETQAAEQQNRQIATAIETEENHFRSYTPDYDDASGYYVRSRAQELLAFYSPQEAQQIMLAEARQMAQEAWQRGIPAPQMVYTMAQARGYRAGSSQTPVQAVAQPQAVQPAAQPVATAPSPAAVVAAAQQGQQATRTLSGGSGSATAAELNAEAILNMSDEEFEAFLKLGQKGANARFAAIG